MRFFEELFNPALKCKRVGHKHRTRTVIVFLSPARARELKVESFFSGSVAFEAERIDDWCPRCDLKHKTSYSVITNLTGLSMPSEDWRELRERGEVRA